MAPGPTAGSRLRWVDPLVREVPATANPRGRAAGDWSSALLAALARADVRRAQTVLADATAGGTSPGRLYLDIVRPALVSLGWRDDTIRPRLADRIGDGVMACLIGAIPRAGQKGAGRAAVMATAGPGIESADGTLVRGLLEADDWRVDLATGGGADSLTSWVRGHATVELAVTVSSPGPKAASSLASDCAGLRRLADPPVILVCDFAGPGARGDVSQVGADEVVHDPDDLAGRAVRHLPAGGLRRWGVRLSREGETLRLAPIGRLDRSAVERLTEVVASRLGSFTSLALDLRHVAELDRVGLERISAWPGLDRLQAIQAFLLVGRSETDQVPAGWCTMTSSSPSRASA